MSKRKYGINWHGIGEVTVFGLICSIPLTILGGFGYLIYKDVTETNRVNAGKEKYYENKKRFASIGSSTYHVLGPDHLDYKPENKDRADVYTYNFQTNTVVFKPYNPSREHGKERVFTFEEFNNAADIQRALNTGCRYARNMLPNLQKSRNLFDEQYQAGLDARMGDFRLFQARHCN